LAIAQTKRKDVILFLENTPETADIVKGFCEDAGYHNIPWFLMFHQWDMLYGRRELTLADAVNVVRLNLTKAEQTECPICLESLVGKPTVCCVQCASMLCLSCKDQVVDELGIYSCPVCREAQTWGGEKLIDPYFS